MYQALFIDLLNNENIS